MRACMQSAGRLLPSRGQAGSAHRSRVISLRQFRLSRLYKTRRPLCLPEVDIDCIDRKQSVTLLGNTLPSVTAIHNNFGLYINIRYLDQYQGHDRHLSSTSSTSRLCLYHRPPTNTHRQRWSPSQHQHQQTTPSTKTARRAATAPRSAGSSSPARPACPAAR